MDLSIVIPVKNEAGNIAPLVDEIGAALDGKGVDYEIVYVDDGSNDTTAAEIARLQATNTRLRLVTHAKSCGQSAAIRTASASDSPVNDAILATSASVSLSLMFKATVKFSQIGSIPPVRPLLQAD